MIDLSLQEKSVNVVNVIDSLRKSQTLQSAGGASVIAEIAGEVATSQRIDEYIAIIREKHVARNAQTMARDLLKALDNGENVHNLLVDAGSRISKMNGSPIGGDGRFEVGCLPGRLILESNIDRPKSLLGDGLLVEGGFGLIYGRPGIGKTWGAFQLALDLAMGRPWFKIPTVQCRVGIVELEMHAYFVQQRLKSLVRTESEAEALENVFFVSKPYLKGRVDILSDETLEGIALWAVKRNLDILIFDALSRTHTKDENSAKDLGEVLSAIDALRDQAKVCVVPLHHEPKRSEDKRKGKRGDDLDAARGSSRLQSDPQTLIRFSEFAEDMLVMKTPKVMLGKMIEPVYLKHDVTGRLVVVEAPADQKERGERNRAKVESVFLAAGMNGLTMDKVCKDSGLKRSAAYNHARALGAKQCEDGLWRLNPDKEPEMLEEEDRGAHYPD